MQFRNPVDQSLQVGGIGVVFAVPLPVGLGLGLVNNIEENADGVSLAALNRAGLDFVGGQIGVGNVVGERMTGFQVGLVNRANATKGFQIGLLNSAWTVTGLQFGAVNVAGTVDGAQIGLLNVMTEKFRWSALPIVNVYW